MADTAQTDPEPRPARRSGVGRILGFLVAFGVVMVLVIALGVVRGWPGWLPGWLPSLNNPFEEQTTDRSGPVLLKSVQDLSRYTAASGSFEVVIDAERDRRFIPDILVGERVLFVAAGTVDAYVEFGGLTEGALVVDEATDTVQVTVPAAELTEPNLDHERSYVVAEQRGVANRFGDFFSGDPERYQEVLRFAEERIAEAASESELQERAQENTRTMLEGMIGSLGFKVVNVRFVTP